MKKILFLLFFTVFQSYARSYFGEWNRNYHELNESLKKSKKHLLFIKQKSQLDLEKLIKDYKERNASSEKKQWYSRYYGRNRHSYY